ncbi:hypothetical protein MBANPS3_011684 [Mucor bainieri]
MSLFLMEAFDKKRVNDKKQITCSNYNKTCHFADKCTAPYGKCQSPDYKSFRCGKAEYWTVRRNEKNPLNSQGSSSMMLIQEDDEFLLAEVPLKNDDTSNRPVKKVNRGSTRSGNFYGVEGAT